MIILAVDPGAKRTGWAILERADGVIKYIDSGVIEYPREDLPFQVYRMQLADFWVRKSERLLETWKPDNIITEIVPSRGFNIPEQGYLANVQITTLHAIARSQGYLVHQVSARTVQSHIAIRGRGKKITKQQVRNGVIVGLPELKSRISEWMKVFEETDALAIGLWYLGYSNK